MRKLVHMWGMFLVLAAPPIGAQRSSAPQVPPCHAGQIDLYREGSDGGMGGTYFGLRNVSDRACRIWHDLKLGVLRSDAKMMVVDSAFELPGDLPGDLAPVVLQPGEKIELDVDTRRCMDATACVRFTGFELSVGGDPAWLRLDDGRGNGASQEFRFELIRARPASPPPMRLEHVSGSLPGLSATLQMPGNPASDLSMHLVLHNAGANPQSVSGKTCLISERVTNSIGTTVSKSQPCTSWLGGVDTDGRLGPGLNASMDFAFPGDLPLCGFEWRLEVTLTTSAGAVEFSRAPFSVTGPPPCAPSTGSADRRGAPDSALSWGGAAFGIRLSVSVRGAGNALPDSAPPLPTDRIWLRSSTPTFRRGQPVELRLFLDNLHDEPVTIALGPHDFEVYVRGPNGSTAHVLPKAGAVDTTTAASLILPPHTQRYVGTVLLIDQYDLGPGVYEVIVSPRGLQGMAIPANANQADWPVGGASTSALIRITP